MKKLILALCLGALALAATAAPKQYSLSSPDGKLVVKVYTGENLSYAVSAEGVCLIAPSEIAMTLSDGTVYGGAAKPSKAVTTKTDRTVKTVVYKKAEVRDCYNELALTFKDFVLYFRAYDSGVAYRFVSRSKADFTVRSEKAEFLFPQDWNLYVPYVTQHTETLESQFYNSFENTYAVHKVSEWNKDRLAFLPLLVDADGWKVCITEADLLNYPGMYLYNGNASTCLGGVFAPYPDKVTQGGHNMLQGEVQTRKDYIAKAGAGEKFPWRVIAVAKEDKALADNDLVYLLASPADEKADWSWIRPGKVAWDWWNDWNLYGVDFKAGINTETYKYYIDFAAKSGIEYVILDEGWSVNRAADLMQVVPEIDLREITSYAASKGVGIVLWAGYWAFNRDMENVCRHYAEMGVKGFKIDFMDRDDQPIVNFYVRAAQTAAKYHMFVDFHGAYKPTGLHRTYPNVINYEGVHGLEQMKWSAATVNQVEYDVTIPFIRMLAGPFDYTQGAMRNASRSNYRPVNSEPMSQGTRCRQLAEFVVFDSPFSMLCDSPSNYLAEPECTEYIAKIPTTWDETRVLDGKVGDYIATARRKGDTWYVGAMTDWSRRDLELDLSFLPAGTYSVTVYRDGPNADKAARDFAIDRQTLASPKSMSIHMASGGGWVAVFTKK